MVDGFQYIIQNHGIGCELDYPYTGEDDSCSFGKERIVCARIKWVAGACCDGAAHPGATGMVTFLHMGPAPCLVREVAAHPTRASAN